MDINKLPPADQTASSRRPRTSGPPRRPAPSPVPALALVGGAQEGGAGVCGSLQTAGVRARRPSSSRHRAGPHPSGPENPATGSAWQKGWAPRLPVLGWGSLGGWALTPRRGLRSRCSSAPGQLSTDPVPELVTWWQLLRRGDGGWGLEPLWSRPPMRKAQRMWGVSVPPRVSLRDHFPGNTRVRGPMQGSGPHPRR